MKFTIITPVYNRCDCIKRCLESVLRQEEDNWEHIIVDDGSTDATYDVIHSIIEGDSRFKLLKLDKNSGTNAARNKGIDNAHGEYIIFLDSDDILAQEAIISIKAIIDLNQEFNYFLFAVNDRIEYYASILHNSEKQKVLFYEDWLNGRIEGDFCHVVKRSFFDNIRFYSKYRIYEDLTFIELYKLSKRQLFTNSVILERDRERRDSVTFEANLYKPNAIHFKKEVLKIKLDKYESDYLQSDNKDAYYSLLRSLYLLSLLNNNYEEIPGIHNRIETIKRKIPLSFRIIFGMHLGWLINLLIRGYSYIKHQIK